MDSSRWNLGAEVSHRIRSVDDAPVEIPIEEALDLHPFQPSEILDVAREYLQAARERGFREVRLIHGRGRGVQRANVQALLRTLPFVVGFRDDASLGATVVVLSDER
jgi:dsDNA-specific endonuclease/ATPase MutS2